MKGTVFGVFIGAACAILAYAIFFRSCAPKPQYVDPVIKSDTVIIRDTIRLPPPEPRVVAVVCRDTILLPVVRDSDIIYVNTAVADSVQVEIPISQSVYQTNDYRATIEGYNARLVDMEIYRQTTVITNTVSKLKSPRWALTVGPGVGYGPHGAQPYIGVSLGFVILSK